MNKNLHEATVETLQQRLLGEIDAQERLQAELEIALETEKALRLENDLLWAHLEEKHPSRVEDARELLDRLKAGGDFAAEMNNMRGGKNNSPRSIVRRLRRAVGQLPGVSVLYHRIKNLRK